MVKNASELSRKVLQNLRTSKTNEQIISLPLSGSAASGEIIVQLGTGNSIEEKKKTTGLWTLAGDGSTPVRFPSEERVSEMISTGSVEEINAIEEAVGLAADGSYIVKSGTTYLNTATTVEGEILTLDAELAALSGVVDSMDTSSVADDNKVVSDVVQTDGKITATTKNISAVKLDGYTVGGDNSGKVANTDTLGEALGKLQGQINGMDLAEVSGEGEVIISVSETDGKVSAGKTLIKDVRLNSYSKDTSKTGEILAIDDVEDALSKLENAITANHIVNSDGSINVTTGTGSTVIEVNIKSGEHLIKKDTNNGGIYTNLSLNKITSSLPAEIKERYSLIATDGSQIGENIDIPKDSHIVSINYITDSANTHYQSLEYVYIDASGETQTTYVDMSSLILEQEFASGITVTDHIAHGVVDLASESFLTVGAGGFKLSGVTNAINSAINALDADVTNTSSDNHVTVQVVETDGKITGVNVTTNDIASANALSQLSSATESFSSATVNEISRLDNEIDAETTRAQSAEIEIDSKVGLVKAQDGEARTYSHIEAIYISGTTVKSDIEQLDSILGKEIISEDASASTVFSSTNTVAKSISDIKKDIDAFKHKLTLSVEDDNKYIDTTIITSSTGTVIGISGKTKAISSSTSSDSAIADSYDVRTFAVNSIVADNTRIAIVENTAEGNNDAVRKIDFTNLSIDCGTF